MKIAMVLAWLAVCALICSSAQAREDDAFRDFFQAMVRKDSEGMRTVVREHRRDMMVAVFVAMRQSATELKDAGLNKEDAAKVRVLLLVCARIARTFDEVYPGRDILYKQFKDARPLVTRHVQAKVTSDVSLADFLKLCVAESAIVSNRRQVATDLESIVAAATGTPASRTLRRLKARRERLRREAAETARRVRLARATVRINRLRQARDEAGLLRMLQDAASDSSTKGRVVAALAEFPSRQVVDALAALLTDKTIQSTVVETLGRIGDDRAVEVLASHIADARIQARIVAALEKVGSGPALKALIQALSDRAVGSHAAAALTRKWGDQAAANFGEIVNDPSRAAPLRQQALRAFASLRSPRQLKELTTWASEPELKVVVAEVLADTKDPGAVAVLVAMLDDESAAPTAMAGLRRIGKPACPALIERLRRFSPSAGMKRAVDILDGMNCRPSTPEAKARLALAKGRVFATVRCGPPGFATAVAALKADDPSFRWTGARVLAVDLGLPAVLLLGMIVYFRRKWLWPSVKVCLHPGECRQIRKAVRRCVADGDAEPGAIVRTLWAHSRFGRRRRIKVETFAAGEAWEIVGHEGQAFADVAPLVRNPYERNDILVSVGRSVRPGAYLARGSNASVRIRVRAKPA